MTAKAKPAPQPAPDTFPAAGGSYIWDEATGTRVPVNAPPATPTPEELP